MKINSRVPLFVLLLLASIATRSAAQSSAFTYQGRLTDGGAPASGPYQMQFTLFPSAVGGDPLGPPIQIDSVDVANGVFTVQLDFGGAAAFDGHSRWLQIAVKKPTDHLPSLLTPRQPITSTPYALRTLVANSADTLSSACTLCVTDAHIQAVDGSKVTGTVANATNATQLNGSLASFDIGGSGHIAGTLRLEANGLFDPETPGLSLSANGSLKVDAPFLPGGRFTILPNGNVGIGNGAPTEKLDVNGNAKFTGTITGNGSGLTNVPGTIKWENVTRLTQAQPNTGYLVDNFVQIAVTLPMAPNLGDIVRVTGVGTGGWKLAQNDGQVILGANLNLVGANWTPHDPTAAWKSVASSADGTKLVAVALNDFIYTSTDSGVTWTQRESARTWWSVASSTDGSKLVAVTLIDGIFTSTNSGVTWTPRESEIGFPRWQSVASSADGTKLVAVASNDFIYTSTDSGVTWTQRESPRSWWSVASSADGTKLVAVVFPGLIYTSTDSGVTWTPRASSKNWAAVASSADGSKLVAGIDNGQIYTSYDSGLNWISHDSTRFWLSVASSADGSKLIAGDSAGHIYISSDSGVSWTPRESNRFWRGVASSGDGAKLIAAAEGGQIYTSNGNTTTGTAGYLTGTQSSAIELQYIGNGKFLPLSHEGTIFSH